jgi:hypothetical protein
MRTRNFLVPQDLIFEFVEAIEENDFCNHIVGTTAESEIGKMAAKPEPIEIFFIMILQNLSLKILMME